MNPRAMQKLIEKLKPETLEKLREVARGKGIQEVIDETETDLDLVFANGGYTSNPDGSLIGEPNEIWLGDGSGEFEPTASGLGASISYGLALGDVDGDGDVDAVFANGGPTTAKLGTIDQSNTLWLNNGDGTLTQSTQLLGDSYSKDVALGDLDGDGDLDAIFANRGSNEVWMNDGGGTFVRSPQSIGDSQSQGVALSDLDGDGDLDAVFANDLETRALEGWVSEPDEVLLNNGDGTFGAPQALGETPSQDVAIGDLNGDGLLDLVFAGATSKGVPAANTIYLATGPGEFAPSEQALGSGASLGVALGDLDGDGDLDAVFANGGHTKTPNGAIFEPDTIWFNDGDGSFTQSSQLLGDTLSSDVSLADLDGDGDLDAVFAVERQSSTSGDGGSLEGGYTIYLNEGDGTFTPGDEHLGETTTYAVAIGDLDQDLLV